MYSLLYRFELVVTMQGTSSTTSQCSKTITSYTSSEILWGQRFKPCITYDDDIGSYCVDHKQFNKTEEVLTPLCSGQRLQEVLMDVECRTSYSINNPIIGLTTNRNENCENNENERTLNVAEIDNDIYCYINDIKKKIIDDGKELRCYTNANQRILHDSNRNKNVIDVEGLIENMEKYVYDAIRLQES